MADLVQSLLRYLDASPTPYHAVTESVRRLQEAGFHPVREDDAWELPTGTRAYTIRNGTSLIAFVCGQKPPHESGFLALGAHTDSPNLRLKPVPDLARSGYRQLGVEVYGGVLLSTWLDRDLSLAGRVILDHGSRNDSTLIDFSRPLLRIPNLAIHLNRGVNSEGLVLNAQTHLVPILGLAAGSNSSCKQLIADELSERGRACTQAQILGWDLSLYDVQRAALAGAAREFIQSARLDNLTSCFAAIDAIAHARPAHDATRICVLYNHEEVGSTSAQGACSPFLRQALERVAHARGSHGPEQFARAMARSFLISADMAHAVHPNYADRHEPAHAPVLGGGPVIKYNANQSYATDSVSAARFAQLCKQVEVPVQHYVVRSDLPCGSTIGPLTAAELGIATVDIGSPLLSMHSIREMTACQDVLALSRVLGAFFG